MNLLDYVVQSRRFDVVPGLGCTHASDQSLLAGFLLTGWGIYVPFVSITVYYRGCLNVRYDM